MLTGIDFVPNNLKNPARKLRVQKTDEHGGFCLNEWREKSMYIVNDEIFTFIVALSLVEDAW